MYNVCGRCVGFNRNTLFSFESIANIIRLKIHLVWMYFNSLQYIIVEVRPVLLTSLASSYMQVFTQVNILIGSLLFNYCIKIAALN